MQGAAEEARNDLQTVVKFAKNPVIETKKRVYDRKKSPEKRIIRSQCPNKLLVRMQIRKTELERNRYLIQMRRGAILHKFNPRTGQPEKRWFIVDREGSTISWTKPTSNIMGIKTRKKKNLADALYLTYGRAGSSQSVQTVDTWLCFTLVFCEKLGKSWVTRELSIGCSDLQQLETWFFGLQSLIPLHHQHKTQAYILWERAMMKVEKIADKQGLKAAKVWQALFEGAIRRVKGSNYKSMMRKLVHVNLARLAREARSKGIVVGDSAVSSMRKVSNPKSASGSPRRTDRKGRSLRDVIAESPSRSPRTTNRRLVTHDLTEKMISRRPYTEKKLFSRTDSGSDLTRF
mmetsp:Transcript_21492/g.30111  ORF Transcript_21492/g.30111 Transcript_21492/m.30111 type:complete len:346 (-) Transcript_21492:184-1221(-)|eukprot:CAMPEP_0185271472 /NCGR_PEP_ID=MMETSP1359-20130426/44871_1 /TAXON_ID=552665 /ORGANISM="Bigelowiella longifila, Strain CCMP242" /LENGTH=345 /DNA_ID=CAMNT_0027863435 /DNA_START=124 /DNA_END=1161 /DNA_ORIENTATION=+